MNRFIKFFLSMFSLRTWTNPKMTSFSSPEGTVTNTGNAHIYGNEWAMFAEASYTAYARTPAPTTKYTLTGVAFLTRILPMTAGGDYLKGSGCSVRTYLKTTITEHGTISFASGKTFTNPVEFDAIEYYGFTGGGHPDLVGWCSFPLEGFQP